MTGPTSNEPAVEFSKRRLFKLLGYTPHPGQVAVHRSKAPRRVLACGVRWGKTKCAAMEALTAALMPADHSFGWVVAPTYDLAEKVFREIVVTSTEHLRHRIVSFREHDRRLLIRNLGGGLSEIRGKSADNPVSLLGEGLDWLVIDEAARLKPHIWESHLTQRLIDRHGWALMISTPRGKGWFYDAWRRGKGGDPAFESWNMPSWSSPFLDKDMIDAERERVPERVFRQEFGGEFLEGSGQVFRYVRECAKGTIQPPIAGQQYYAGLDLAKVEDFTVLVILNKQREVVYVDRFNKIDWGLQISRIQTATAKYNRARVYVDTTGKGEPVFESLCKEGVKVEPYVFTNKSKASLIDSLAMMFEKREIVIPRDWPIGIDELEAFEYSVTDQGTVRTSAPGGMHDDCVIALALAAYWVRTSNKTRNWTKEELDRFSNRMFPRSTPDFMLRRRYEQPPSEPVSWEWPPDPKVGA
jgi:hypothetical protein